MQKIIDNTGFENFLKIEESVVLDIDVDNVIIATGGSVIYSKKAVKHLQSKGLLVYMKLGYDEIEQRIINIANRGIVFGDGKGLRDLFNERKVLYEKYADLIIDCSALTIEDVGQKIIEGSRKLWIDR